MFKIQSNTLSVKPMQNVNTHSKYGNTFWCNLNADQKFKFWFG